MKINFTNIDLLSTLITKKETIEIPQHQNIRCNSKINMFHP